ncbi:MAG: ROK family protein [bacterium]|nr:ROK family protein [bacterium]
MSDIMHLGLDTGGTGTKFVLVDADGETVGTGEIPTNPDDPVDSFGYLPNMLNQWQGDREPLVPRVVGLACAGIVDPENLTLGRSPNLPGWEGRDLGAVLRRVFPASGIVLVNDVNAALYGEYRQGAGQGCRDLVMLALGTGVGGGVLVDGKLLTGGHHGAAELGHMVLDPQGPVCRCGNRGCLEAWAGSVALRHRARQAAQGEDDGAADLRRRAQDRGCDLDPRDLAEAAAAGNELASSIYAEAGTRLGQAVGNLLNVLDPDKVIIGGGVAQAGELLLEPCCREARRIVLAEGARETPIVPAELGVHAAAVGACWLAREAEAGG